MNIKNLITVATAMMFAAGLLIWSKAGETECIYAIDEKDKIIRQDYFKYKNMPLSRYQAYRIVKQAAVYAGMPEHISCHSLRKTFGYHAWKQGVPPAMLMMIYNHSSYQITKRYLGIIQEEKDDVFYHVQL